MDLIFPSLPSIIVLHHPLALRLQTKCKPRRAKLPYFLAHSKSCELRTNERRSANYHPTIWDHKLIESLRSPYTYEGFSTYLEELKIGAKWTLKLTKEPLVQLELVDSIQRMGLTYHFEEEIKDALDRAYSEACNDLYMTALNFRLLRQNGYSVSSDVFNKFMNKDGRFMESLSKDAEGLLSLYEASHLLIHGEDVLEEAMNFSSESLKSFDVIRAKQVQHSLQLPLNWRMPRLEARNFIDVYERDDNNNLVLLELAKLDFNLVQSIYQRELIDLSRWWRDLGFKETLSFSRDRLVENFFWAMGIAFEPQFSKCRKDLTKFICILSTIDDMYDVYGSLDELELFTDAVDRWDLKAMENLPNYMKICYLAMFNFANEIAIDVQKDHGFNALPYFKKEWARLCKSYLVEARWFSNGYTPTLDEYLGNAWISVGGPAAMVHSFFLRGETITNESLNSLKHYSDLFYWSSVIIRLSDDLGTSEAEMKRGDVPKSIQCHMKEKGVSEEKAREHIKGLISSAWKKLNEERVKSSLHKSIINMALNMARTGQCIFEDGDGIGTSDGVIKDQVISLFFEPVSTKLDLMLTEQDPIIPVKTTRPNHVFYLKNRKNRIM